MVTSSGGTLRVDPWWPLVAHENKAQGGSGKCKHRDCAEKFKFLGSHYPGTTGAVLDKWGWPNGGGGGLFRCDSPSHMWGGWGNEGTDTELPNARTMRGAQGFQFNALGSVM